MDYGWVSSEYVTIGTQLVSPRATDAAADPGHPHGERVPPPGADGTLLAIVPIPGTQTSLAIVGYAISTAAAPRHAPAPSPRPRPRPKTPRRSTRPKTPRRSTRPKTPRRTRAACSSTACSAGSGPTTARSR